MYLISLSENQTLWLIKKSTLWFFAQPALKSFHMRRKILDQLFTNLLNKYSMKEPNLCRPEPAHLFLRSWIKEFSFSKTLLIIHSSQGDFKVSIKCANKWQWKENDQMWLGETKMRINVKQFGWLVGLWRGWPAQWDDWREIYST